MFEPSQFRALETMEKVSSNKYSRMKWLFSKNQKTGELFV